MSIDLSLPPYNCRGDWTGSDATATNNTNALLQAIYDISQPVYTPTYENLTCGGVLMMPKGQMMVSSKITLPRSVWLKGQSRTSSVLHFKQTTLETDHLVDIGDGTTHAAAMDCGIQDMTVWGVIDNAGPGVGAIYSNNIQDTWNCVHNVCIFAGSRSAVKMETGWGGATFVHMSNVIANTHHADNPTFYFNYGDATQVILEGMEPSGEPGLDGTIGMKLDGGRFDIRHFHAEYEHIGIDFNITAGMAEVDHVVGNGTNPFMMVVENKPGQLHKITIKNVDANGSNQTLYNNQPGGTPIFGNIDAEIRV